VGIITREKLYNGFKNVVLALLVDNVLVLVSESWIIGDRMIYHLPIRCSVFDLDIGGIR